MTEMDEQTGKGFRSAWFGGFRREDVVQYIEQTDSKYHAETEELRRQLTEAQAALGELREPERGPDGEKRRAARAAGGDDAGHGQDPRPAGRDRDRAFPCRPRRSRRRTARAQELAAENDRLTDGERPARREVRAVRRLQGQDRGDGAVRLPARQADGGGRQGRAAEAAAAVGGDDRAGHAASWTRRRENYRTVLARSQQESAEMARKAGEVLGEIDRISCGARQRRSGRRAKSGLRDVLGNLRPKTED